MNNYEDEYDELLNCRYGPEADDDQDYHPIQRYDENGDEITNPNREIRWMCPWLLCKELSESHEICRATFMRMELWEVEIKVTNTFDEMLAFNWGLWVLWNPDTMAGDTKADEFQEGWNWRPYA